MECPWNSMECPWTFRGTNFLFRPQFSFLTKVHGKSTEIHGIRQIPWIPYVKVGDCKVLVLAAFPWLHGQIINADRLTEVVGTDQLSTVSP